MSRKLRDKDYLEHIQEAIGKISRYVPNKDEAEFMASEIVQDAVIRNLEIIGEAVTKLSPELKAGHADIPWSASPGCATGSFTVMSPSIWKSSGALWKRSCRTFWPK